MTSQDDVVHQALTSASHLISETEPFPSLDSTIQPCLKPVRIPHLNRRKIHAGGLNIEHREELEQLQARGEVELVLGGSSNSAEDQRLTEVHLKQLGSGKLFQHKHSGGLKATEQRRLASTRCQGQVAAGSIPVRRLSKC
eukprot:743340-Amphidinium_carterae.2